MKIINVTMLMLLAIFALCPSFILSQLGPKVAIIGGGIGGTSCAYFLRQLFIKRISLTLFEKDVIGGRLRVMDIDGKKFEAGGSVIHVRNEYMNQFTKLLDFKTIKQHSGKLGIFDGEKFVFEESNWYFLTIADLLWHYGFSIFQLFKDVGLILNDFSRVYPLQEQRYAYTTVDRLLNAINPAFTNLTKSSINEILLGKEYSPAFLNEFVQSIMLVNYGQTNNISGFAGYVSLAGAEDSLWSVEGGNKLVAEGLLKFSEARVVKANVREIELLPNNKFLVKHKQLSSDQVERETFDIIILCSPLIKGSNNIKFVNFSTDFKKYERPYHQTVSTFVQGILRPEAFGNKASLPDDILTNSTNLLFNSISKLATIKIGRKETDEGIYKVFSRKPLSKETIEKLFKSVKIVKDHAWLAYPHYRAPERFVPFILYPGIYYANAIELSASAMEMSIIAAKNVALLLVNSIKNPQKIDVAAPVLKDEL